MAQESTQPIYQVLVPSLRAAKHPIFALIACACLFIAGCASSPEGHGAKAEAAARIAQKMVGVRYVWGVGDPREGFDCSGLVYYSYNKVGIPIPRTPKANIASLHLSPNLRRGTCCSSIKVAVQDPMLAST